LSFTNNWWPAPFQQHCSSCSKWQVPSLPPQERPNCSTDTYKNADKRPSTLFQRHSQSPGISKDLYL
jgi:hypothetical protein